jgi:hypothetical protein
MMGLAQIMSMNKSQLEVYKKQEAARVARQAARKEVDREMHANLCTFWLTVAVCAVVVVVAIVIV